MSSHWDRQVGGQHYKGMAIQPSQYIVANNIPWLPANAIKYLSRYALKGGLQDLEKALHYVELAIEDYKNDINRQASAGDSSAGIPRHINGGYADA